MAWWITCLSLGTGIVFGIGVLTDKDGGNLKADQSHAQDSQGRPARVAKPLATVLPDAKVQQAERCFGTEDYWRVERVANIIPLSVRQQNERVDLLVEPTLSTSWTS